MAIVAPLPVVVRGPTWISVDNSNPVPGSTGVCVMQIFFQGSADVSSVRFKNYYVQNISIKSRSIEDTAPTTQCICGSEMQSHMSWKTTIDHRVLMPNPDCEDGCQDYVIIHNHEALTSWSNVVAFAFTLRQPSCRWKMFSIKELEISGKSNLPPVVAPNKPSIGDQSNSTSATGDTPDSGQVVGTNVEQEPPSPSNSQELSPDLQIYLTDMKNILHKIRSLRL